MLHILTLHWNNKEKLQKLYISLLPAVEGLDYQWLIRDHASKDGSVEFLKSIENDNIKPVYYNTNKENFSQGVNYLFEQANPKDEDYILLLNNDIVICDKDSIKNMIQQMKSNVGAVGAKLLHQDNTIAHTGVIFSKQYNNMPWHYKYKEPVSFNESKNRYFQVCTGAFLLVKADSFRRAGKMDPGYFWSFEDVSLCLAIHHQLKQKVIYCGDTLIYHEENGTLKKNPVHKLFLQSNLSLFRKQWRGIYQIDHQLYLDDLDYNLV